MSIAARELKRTMSAIQSTTQSTRRASCPLAAPTRRTRPSLPTLDFGAILREIPSLTIMPKATIPASTKSTDKRGFAAFIDLRDSTYVWNQNADIAEEILQDLNRIAVLHSKQWDGKIGNFTGDGFLLLFEQAEFAIRGLAAVLDAWEDRRTHYRAKLEALDVLLPDDHSLSLRTGVAFGNYREISSGDHLAGNVAGEAINHASRCESASKAHFEATIENAPKPLGAYQRVFIAASVYGLVSKKTDYWYSKQLPVTHKGYERTTAEGFATTTDYIYAFWPKADQSPANTAHVSQATLQRVAKATAQINAADRLLEARHKITVGDELRDAAQGTLGKTARDVLSRAIAAYRAGLQSVSREDAPSYYAATQVKMGIALCDQANLLAGEDRANRLNDAVDAYREALKVTTLEAAPAAYAMTQNNLGTALRNQANLLAGEDRANRLNDAVDAFREALKVRTLEAAPAAYAGTQNNLGITLRDQAALLKGEARAERLAESRKAFELALTVFDARHHPHDHQEVVGELAHTMRLINESGHRAG